jgi:Spy/CpxP family protein refolding chaperone
MKLKKFYRQSSRGRVAFAELNCLAREPHFKEDVSMQKRIVIGVVVALLLVVAVVAQAGKGMPGCAPLADPNVTPEQLKAFMVETRELREEMMLKRLAIVQEQRKEKPDSAKIEALKKEMAALQVSIHAIGKKHGMSMGMQEKCGDCKGMGMGAMQGSQGSGMKRKCAMQPMSSMPGH